MRALTTLLLFINILTSCSVESEINDSSIPSPSVWVVNGGDNSISIINPQTFKQQKKIFLNAPPNTYLHHISANKNFDKFALALPEYDFSMGHAGLHGLNVNGYLSIFNKKSQKLENTIKVPYANHNAVFNSDESEIWTGLVSHTGKILVYDVKSGNLIKEISVGPDPHEIMFSEDGKYVITSCMESSFVTIIDASKKEILKEIKVDPFPTNVWQGKTSEQIIVENSNSNSINFIDLNELKGVDHIDLNFKPGFSKFDSKGNLWICAKGENNVYVYSNKGNYWAEIQKIATQNDPHALLFLDNKTWVVNQKQNNVEIFDTDTYKKIIEIPVGLKPNGIIFVP